MARYIDADELLEELDRTFFANQPREVVRATIEYFPTAKVREDSWAIGKDNRYLDLTKLYEYFRSKKITKLKFFDDDIVHEFKMVVRGEWEVIDYAEPKRYGCSVCHIFGWHPTNYCPNCGADMRGEE